MADHLAPVSPAALPQNAAPTAVELRQIGNNNTQIAQVGNYYYQQTNYVYPPQMAPCGMVVPGPLNAEYYNLFVLEAEEFRPYSGSTFLVAKEDALTECVSPDICDTVCSLSTEAIRFLKTLPSIFAAENEGDSYGKSTDTQMAYFGFVTDITVQNSAVIISCQMLYQVPQKLLNAHRLDLDIAGTEKYNEFDHPHWAVKHAPLVRLLRDAGLSFFNL